MCLCSLLSAAGTLNDTTVGIFRNCEKLRLRSASVRCCPVSAEAFRLALCPHRLLELDGSWVSWGSAGLTSSQAWPAAPSAGSACRGLSLSGLHLDWGALEGDVGTCRSFSSLQNLRTLHVDNTDLKDSIPEDICSLPHLETLDISCSTVSTSMQKIPWDSSSPTT